MARAGGTNLSLAFLFYSPLPTLPRSHALTTLRLTSFPPFSTLSGVKSDAPWKHFAVAFLIALALYAVAYPLIENRRTRKGPWHVTFTKSPVAEAEPSLTINQPWLNLSNVVIAFPGLTAAPTNETMDFRVPKDVPFEIPFGTCVFEDTTFLPGTIVFKMFGHKIQLIPRVLTVDGKEYPWKSRSTLTITNDISK